MIRPLTCLVLLASIQMADAQEKAKPVFQPKTLELLSASLTMGPGIQPMNGKVDPGFPYFGGTVAWRGHGKLEASQIRLYLLDAAGQGKGVSRRLTVKAWEPADPLNPEQWRFKSVWPGGPAEGRTVRLVVMRRGQEKGRRPKGPPPNLELAAGA